ncbi:MAG: YifB family Mg chelatase-like AAA ATPase [Actinomycetota bacterium]|nr:YifB family Mg chelatase-like AAA ATPase [Actinomycetota bacterium]
MPSRVQSVVLTGVEGHVVDIEVHVGAGLPRTAIIGLPGASLTESRDRCKAAVVNSGFAWPNRNLTIALSPAELPKSGAHFDLAIALGVLAATEVIPSERLTGVLLLGELALDGRLRAVRGVLPSVLAAADRGLHRVVVPEANVAEARLTGTATVIGVRSLAQAVAVLRGQDPPDAPPVPPLVGDGGRWNARLTAPPLDLADVVGQPEARRTVEVAAAGGHHLLLNGPPGSGKTMLAERLPGLLPDLDEEESWEVTAVHSVAGVLPPEVSLVCRPPFVDPHHTASTVAIVGGGSREIRPGAISLAHRGVLFLDEAPELRADVLDALRQSLESGQITIGRGARTAHFPARYQLVLAANPCPCGHSSGKGLHCECAPAAMRRYRDRISGPIRDRMDLHRTMTPVSVRALRGDAGRAESTAVVAARVAAARNRQRERLAGTPWRRNADIPGPDLRRCFPVLPAAMRLVEEGMHHNKLTARGADRVLRVAWTLADLADAGRPGVDEVGEAYLLRTSGALPARPGLECAS